MLLLTFPHHYSPFLSLNSATQSERNVVLYMIALNYPFCSKMYYFSAKLFFENFTFCYPPSVTIFTFVSQLFLPPYHSTEVPYSLQSHVCYLASSSVWWDWGVESNCRWAVDAVKLQRRGSIDRYVLISSCQRRVNTWLCPIHSYKGAI